MSRGEERTSIFFLTALSVGCLTEALTRFISLMRCTPSIILCGVFGTISLFFLLFQLGLGED